MPNAAIQMIFKVMSISMGPEGLYPAPTPPEGMPSEPAAQRYNVTISPVPDTEAAVQMTGGFNLVVSDPAAFTVGQSLTLTVTPA